MKRYGDCRRRAAHVGVILAESDVRADQRLRTVSLRIKGDILEQHLLSAGWKTCQSIRQRYRGQASGALTLDWRSGPRQRCAARIAAAAPKQFDTVNGFEDLLMIWRTASVYEVFPWSRGHRYATFPPISSAKLVQVLQEPAASAERQTDGKNSGLRLIAYAKTPGPVGCAVGVPAQAWAYLIRSCAEANIRHVEVHFDGHAVPAQRTRLQSGGRS